MASEAGVAESAGSHAPLAATGLPRASATGLVAFCAAFFGCESYFAEAQIFGGLVFVPLSEPYLRSEWGELFEERAPVCLAEPWLRNIPRFEEEEAPAEDPW